LLQGSAAGQSCILSSTVLSMSSHVLFGHRKDRSKAMQEDCFSSALLIRFLLSTLESRLTLSYVDYPAVTAWSQGRNRRRHQSRDGMGNGTNWLSLELQQVRNNTVAVGCIWMAAGTIELNNSCLYLVQWLALQLFILRLYRCICCHNLQDVHLSVRHDPVLCQKGQTYQRNSLIPPPDTRYTVLAVLSISPRWSMVNNVEEVLLMSPTREVL